MRLMKSILFTILFILSIYSLSFAANSSEWSEKDVVKYTYMVLGKYITENSFVNASEARAKVTTHLSTAFQLLKNEGIIYQFNINSPVIKDEAGDVLVDVEFLKDVDSEGLRIKMKFYGSKITQKKVIG